MENRRLGCSAERAQFLSQCPTPGPSRMMSTRQHGNLNPPTSKTTSVEGPGERFGVSESQDSFFTKQDEGNPPSSSKPHRFQQSIDILENMPDDVDPFEYMEQLKKTVIRNAAEDALLNKMMKRHLNLANFKSKRQKYNPSYELLPQNGLKSSSKSAPSTPVQPLLINEYKESQKLQEPNSAISTNSTTTPFKKITPKDQDFSKIEAAFVQLSAAIELVKEVQSQRLHQNQNPEPLLHIRGLCKKTLALMECSKYTFTEMHQKTIIQAALKITELFADCSEDRDTKETGVFAFVEKLINCLMDVSPDPIVSLSRGNFVHAVVGAMNTPKIRHLILSRLFQAVMGSFNRISRATKSHDGGGILDINEITGIFRYLQLIELILNTTSDEAWIEDGCWNALKSLETICLRSVPFANVQIFMARVVVYGRRHRKLPPVVTDIHDISEPPQMTA